MEFLFYRPEFWCTLLIFVIGVVLWRMLFSATNRKRLPGPWGLPIVGYIPFLGIKMNKTVTALSKRYGDVFQLPVGTRKVVVVNGQRAIREALLSKGIDFAGRPNFYSYVQLPSFGLADYSPSYRTQKQLLQKAFHKFTFERRAELMQVAHKAVHSFVKVIKDGAPLDPKRILMESVCSIVGFICYGKFYDAKSEEVATILSTASEFSNAVLFGVTCDYIPEAEFILKRKLKNYKELIDNMTNYSDKLASAHIESYDGENMRDISDMFRKAGEDMSEDEKKVLKLNDRMLKDNVATLFGAGFGTISETLRYSMMMMAHHPHIQIKVQEEIDQVIGRENYPDADDINTMPYTMAVINEIYRHHSMSAFAFTHTAICDTELDGYFIAKGTPVMFNLWSAHRDSTVFTNPDKFDPDRFLTAEGKIDAKMIDYVIPYGLGLRRCAGEIIARMEVIVFFLTLLQRCCIKEVLGHPLNPEDCIMTLGVCLRPFQVSFDPRYSGAFDMNV